MPSNLRNPFYIDDRYLPKTVINIDPGYLFKYVNIVKFYISFDS